MAEMTSANNASRKHKRQRRKNRKNKHGQNLQGHYADLHSPIASTPIKYKPAENSKSIESKSFDDAHDSNCSKSKDKEKFLSPRKLMNENDQDDKPRTKKARTKLNYDSATSSNLDEEKNRKEIDAKFFSPMLKLPRPSRSTSASPPRTRGRRDIKLTTQSQEKKVSDASSAEEAIDAGNMEDFEDEEEENVALPPNTHDFNPFYFMKTLPKYEDIVKAKRPISLPEKSRDAPKICLVLDLDETLVHCSVDELKDPHMQFPVRFNGVDYTVYVKKRPHMDYFLKRASKLFEIVIFTASHRVYAEKLMNMLDPHRNLIKYRLYRDDCLDVFGDYLKDLNVLGRDLSKVVLVDNSPHAFGYQVNNGIPIETWHDDEADVELLNLLPFLESLVDVDDVRPIVERQFQIQKLIDATSDGIV